MQITAGSSLISDGWIIHNEENVVLLRVHGEVGYADGRSNENSRGSRRLRTDSEFQAINFRHSNFTSPLKEEKSIE